MIILIMSLMQHLKPLLIILILMIIYLDMIRKPPQGNPVIGPSFKNDEIINVGTS